ncbi:histidine ammonia-lyase [Aestuariivirga litoralis]|uniref:Histidine ammonia-lyase n=1 Tax=Aestuariivirga litoralis TaxID=2650924 RepID=A0A2W2CAH0_9HYPH|nr:aromatic amino acid lyase [Aestuariivirga litoralis]PZF77173.1 histidine ammonia-lyase [Aestuariivirga litoralis]
MTVTLGSRADLTLEAARRVAWGGEPVALGDAAKLKIAQARQDFLTLIAREDIVIYGVNTGYGHQAKRRLTPAERTEQAKAPTHHRAASWGDPLPQRVLRGIVLARLANVIEGHAALSPHVADAVVAMLGGESLPPVPARGQGGAGEILSLSYLFLPLSQTVELAEKDLLSLINGSPAASALVTDAALAARARLELVADVFALAAEAFNAPLGHFAAELETLWNNPHDAWALDALRRRIGGGHGGERRPYQAPVSIRIMPRILGEAHRAMAAAETIAAQSLAAVSDNPVVFPAGERLGPDEVVSTGGYHNAQAPAAMDALTAADANLAVLCSRVASKLQDGPVSLLPPFLGYPEGRDYLGCLAMAMVGYEEEIRMLAQPTLLPGSESGGFAQDDVASPVFLAWTKQEKAGELLELSLASLAPVALRAFDVTGRPVPEALRPLAAQIRQHFPDDGEVTAMGQRCASLAAGFRARVYSA